MELSEGAGTALEGASHFCPPLPLPTYKALLTKGDAMHLTLPC
jgi:hypothetical protein